jgi:undecaprenyl-diphosphatase
MVRAWRVTVTGIGLLAALGCVVLLTRGLGRPALFAVGALAGTLVLRLALVELIARPRPAGQLAPASS